MSTGKAFDPTITQSPSNLGLVLPYVVSQSVVLKPKITVTGDQTITPDPVR